MFGQIGKYRSGSAVLLLIGKHAAFGDGTEPMQIYAGLQHIFGIEREQGVLRSVITDPDKRGQPFASVPDSGPLNVRARGVRYRVDSKHSNRERAKANDPTP